MNEYEIMIKNLENRVTELERRTQCEGDRTLTVRKWQPKGGDWWISKSGKVQMSYHGSTSAMKEFGMERQTEEQAERAAVEMRRFNRLLALRDELCGDDEVDWEDIDFRKYYLFFNHDNGKWVSTYDYTCYETITHYFTSKESAQKACDMLNSGEVEL